MLPRITRKKHVALSGLLPALLLIGCASDNARPVTPAAERVAEVPEPAIPDGKVPCEYDSARQCLDDEQTATLISDFAAALDAANAKLHWLAIFFGFAAE